MKNTILLTFIFLLFTSISCEKEDGITSELRGNAIIGTWNHIDEIPSGGIREDYRYFDVETLHTFELDGTYTYKVNYYGFKDENPNELMGQSENKGTFEVNNDSVFMRVFENTSWEKGFKPKPETIPLNGEAYGNRFTIKNETLTLYYISYPADAPVQTQMSFKRVE
ncbi:hypothetical protein [Maribacter cobaltidurans]|uniref:Uncharacterized protein n=1 Tax=Maribacter cobaltidurans TaxID=1178778 RepID=A0A223V861_9FLAO|nr:hypothetical protein [Maribacter cobaltidurans]ASV31427.1 hypothetical protein CJ263_15035 [Maribacter cobaltidurans]GGD82338.1 hypothetical protein GCM10011412_20170 [Maribacter cobaltidurans]